VRATGLLYSGRNQTVAATGTANRFADFTIEADLTAGQQPQRRRVDPVLDLKDPSLQRLRRVDQLLRFPRRSPEVLL